MSENLDRLDHLPRCEDDMDEQLVRMIREDVTTLSGQLLENTDVNVSRDTPTDNTKMTYQYRSSSGSKEVSKKMICKDRSELVGLFDKESGNINCMVAEKTSVDSELCGSEGKGKTSSETSNEASLPQFGSTSVDGYNILDPMYTQKFLEKFGGKIMNYVFKDQSETIHVRCYEPNSINKQNTYTCSCSVDKMSAENVCKHIQLLKNSVTPATELPVKKMQVNKADGVSLANRKPLHTPIKKVAKKTRYMCVVCGKLYMKQSSLGTHMHSHAMEPSSCSYCGKVFMSQAMLNAHLNLHGEFPYKCSQCDKTFVLEPLLNKHVAKEHKTLNEKNEKLNCIKCGKEFATKLRLDIHARCHNVAAATFKCDVCGKGFTTQLRLDIHTRTHCNNCSVCGKYFPTRTVMQHHIRHSHKLPKTNMCHICGKGVFTAHGLKKHLLIHNKGVKFVCEVCGMSFTQRWYLHKHMPVHSDLRPFVCEVCGATFKRRNYLNFHMRGVHRRQVGPPVDPCTVCGKTLNANESKAEHMRLHTECPLKCSECDTSFRSVRAVLRHEKYAHKTETLEGGFACDQCPNSYKSMNRLTTHKSVVHRSSFRSRSSGTGSLFPCDECGRSYMWRGGLQYHKMTAHGTESKGSDTLYSCDKCDKSYTFKMSLYQHTRTVHDECTSYPCKICSKVFTNKIALYNHAPTHSDKRPYACQVCNKTYKRQSTLATHATIHSGIKPFKCNFCDKQFRRKYFLQAHIRSHTKEKPFGCEICGKVFSQLGDRNRHRIKFHNFPAGKKVTSIIADTSQ